MNKRKLVLGILFVIVVFSSPVSYSLEVATHELINENILSPAFNGVSLDGHLKNNLGFAAGVNDRVLQHAVFQWVKDGGRYEDKPGGFSIPYLRSVNHFHNPLTKKGFSGLFGRRFLSGESMVDWAQKPTAAQSPGGPYSWRDAREYYYRALTALDRTQRERYFAQAFRGVGQLMHLVQDASVPSHTRDDFHLLPDFEGWVQKNFHLINKDPELFHPSILARMSSGLPISNIFDTNQYDGTNPEITASDRIGITEYANANFFSEDTIRSKAFPFPRIDGRTEVVERLYPSVWGEPYFRDYYLKNCCGETNKGKGYLLAAVDYLDDWRKKAPAEAAHLEKVPALDGNVYRDYASLLLPRAVGYSAGLLDYFFRGVIEITPSDQGVYARTDKPGEGFGKITLMARNKSPEGEEMAKGTIELVVWYKEALEDPFQSKPVPTKEDFTYRVVPESNQVGSIPRGAAVKLVFDLGENPIPLWATDLYLQVVYRGTLGQEAGAVAVGFKDIREPTPVDYVNNLDRVCLFGNWHVAGSPEAIDLVDPDKDGRANLADPYPHDLRDLYIKFSPLNNPTLASQENHDYFSPFLGAGGFIRIYVLSDPYFHLSSKEVVVNTHEDDWFTHLHGGYYLTKSAITNQVVHEEMEKCCEVTGTPRCGTDYSNPKCCERVYAQGCNVRYHPEFFPFRGVPRWKGAMITHYMTEYPPRTQCSWDVLD